MSFLRATSITSMTLVALSVAMAASTALGQTLRLRKGVELPQGVVASDLVAQQVSMEGVLVSAGSGPNTPSVFMLGWDQVASVYGDLAPMAAAYSDRAETAWRARSRLERGDLAGAELLYESLFSIYAGREGPTAQAIAGGLLLCRVSRGAQVLAVQPWLNYVYTSGLIPADLQPRIVRGGEFSDPLDVLPVDPTTGLCPSLPPIWLNTAAVRTSAAMSRTKLKGRAEQLAALYELSQRFEVQLAAPASNSTTLNVAGAPVTSLIMPELPQASDDGLLLIWEIVSSRCGDQAQRASARTRLSARLSATNQPATWVRAWCQTAVGRSLLRESGDEMQLLGVAELMSVPAAFEAACPYLTGLAMAEAATALFNLGDARGGAAIRQRLADRLPGHPALEWDVLRAASDLTSAAALQNQLEPSQFKTGSEQPLSVPPASGGDK